MLSDDQKFESLFESFFDTFDYKYTEFRLNPALDLCLIDVDSGSDTKIMVK